MTKYIEFNCEIRLAKFVAQLEKEAVVYIVDQPFEGVYRIQLTGGF